MISVVKPFGIMGVLNLTPDSFSDGGAFASPTAALARALALADEGCDIIDIGAESSRPGASSVDIETEWQRLEPTLALLAKSRLTKPLSIDTQKPEIIQRALDYGIRFVNHVGGSADDYTLKKLLAIQGSVYCAMHMHGTPATMQEHPLQGRAGLEAVRRFANVTTSRLSALGFAPEQIMIDPGIGFGKDDAGNLALMAAIPELAHRYRLLVGVSRKGFIGRALGIANPSDRDAPSKMLELGLAFAGAHWLRTHQVAPLARLRALLRQGEA